MFKVGLCSCLLTLIICASMALDSEECKKKPKDKHCLIEWAVRDRWPHQVRYVYDWATAKCFQIRWSTHCPELPPEPKVNNWSAEESCLSECGGWA